MPELAQPGGTVDLGGIVHLGRNRREPGDEDHGREREDSPGLHEDDREHRQRRLPEPLRWVEAVDLADVNPREVVDPAEHPVHRPVQVEMAAAGQQVVDERPVHDAELRVEDPEEADRAHGHRRRPRQQDQQPQEPAAAERPHERVGEDAGADQHDRLRGEREDDRVPQRPPEVVVVPRIGEVVEPDELAGELAGGRVGHAQVDREHERHADEQDDEESRRADQGGREEAAILEEIAEAPRLRPGLRHRCHRAAVLPRSRVF